MNIQNVVSSSLSTFSSSVFRSYTSASTETLTGDFVKEIKDQILNDPNISNEEKQLLLKLDLTDSSFVSLNEKEMLVNQLIAGCEEGHPYLYFYHFLRSSILLMSAMNESETPDANLMNQALGEINESIRLNPSFGYGYFIRAIIRLQQEDLLSARADLLKAASLGCEEAQWVLFMLEFPN